MWPGLGEVRTQVCFRVARCVCLSHCIKLVLLHIFITWVLPSRRKPHPPPCSLECCRMKSVRWCEEFEGSGPFCVLLCWGDMKPLLLHEHAPLLSQHVMNSLFASKPDQRYCTDRCLTMAALVFLQLILSSWSSSLMLKSLIPWDGHKDRNHCLGKFHQENVSFICHIPHARAMSSLSIDSMAFFHLYIPAAQVASSLSDPWMGCQSLIFFSTTVVVGYYMPHV